MILKLSSLGELDFTKLMFWFVKVGALLAVASVGNMLGAFILSPLCCCLFGDFTTYLLMAYICFLQIVRFRHSQFWDLFVIVSVCTIYPYFFGSNEFIFFLHLCREWGVISCFLDFSWPNVNLKSCCVLEADLWSCGSISAFSELQFAVRDETYQP